MLKAVLFDLDNTLVDWSAAEPWEDVIPQRLQRVMTYVNDNVWPLRDVELPAFFQAFAERMTVAWAAGSETLHAPKLPTVLAETVCQFGVPPETLDHEVLLDVYDWQPFEGETVYPDAVEVLPVLHRHGIEMGIITNADAPMRVRDRELEAFELLHLFPRCRLSAADVGVLKPHRDIFDHALKLIDATPDEVVFVGDNLLADVKGAQDAGIKAIWRKSKPDHQLHRDGIKPDGAIMKLHDMLPLLDEWYPGWRNGDHT